MDEINYRRVIALPKLRCEDCGATSYQDRDLVYRCVVCDHELFEVCLDCGHLVGWCECDPAEKATLQSTRTNAKSATRKRTAKATAKSRKR